MESPWAGTEALIPVQIQIQERKDHQLHPAVKKQQPQRCHGNLEPQRREPQPVLQPLPLRPRQRPQSLRPCPLLLQHSANLRTQRIIITRHAHFPHPITENPRRQREPHCSPSPNRRTSPQPQSPDRVSKPVKPTNTPSQPKHPQRIRHPDSVPPMPLFPHHSRFQENAREAANERHCEAGRVQIAGIRRIATGGKDGENGVGKVTGTDWPRHFSL